MIQKNLKSQLFLAALGALISVTTTAGAAERNSDSIDTLADFDGEAITVPNADLRPSWVQGDGCMAQPNGSFFVGTAANYESAKFLDRQILDDGYTKLLRQEYDDKTRDYDMRQKAGLNDMGSIQAYNNSMIDVRRDLVRSVTRSQTQGYANNMYAAVKRDEIAAPIVYGSSAASFYFGNALDFTVAPDYRVWARADVNNRVGEMRVNTPVVNSAVQMDGSDYARMGLGPDGLPVADPSGVRHEKYKVSFNRALSLWDMSSEVSYGGTSSTVRAALTKPIVRNFTGVVETVQPMANAIAAGAPTEQIVRLMYGITF